MASEDSDQFLPRLPVIHPFRELGDLDETCGLEMPAGAADLQALREQLEVIRFRGTQWMRPEERNDDLEQLASPVDLIPEEILRVVVVSSIDRHASHAEEALKAVEY